MTSHSSVYPDPAQNDLFQAVLEDPDDNQSRLVFADWCEENGDEERAEFIRLQIEADQDRQVGRAVSAYNLYMQRELWHEHGRRWNAPLHRKLAESTLQQRSRRSQIRRWYYARGFVTAVEIEWSALTNCASVMFQLGPIQALRVVNMLRDAAKTTTADQQCLSKLSELTLIPAMPIARYARGNPAICNTIRDLLRAPAVASLSKVQFHNANPELVMGYIDKIAKERNIHVDFRGLFGEAPDAARPQMLLDWLKEHRLDMREKQ